MLKYLLWAELIQNVVNVFFKYFITWFIFESLQFCLSTAFFPLFVLSKNKSKKDKPDQSAWECVTSMDLTPQEILPPEFVLTKADAQLSEEEKKAYEEYEKNLKDLNQKKEKYRNVRTCS